MACACAVCWHASTAALVRVLLSTLYLVADVHMTSAPGLNQHSSYRVIRVGNSLCSKKLVSCMLDSG
jgi:hypothetical protein